MQGSCGAEGRSWDTRNWNDKSSVSGLTYFGAGNCEDGTGAGKSDATPEQDLMSGELLEGPRDEVGSSEEGEKSHKQSIPQGEMSRVANIEIAINWSKIAGARGALR